MTEYAIVIEDAGENLSAYVPDLPGCVATGTTIEDVTARIREAIAFTSSRYGNTARTFRRRPRGSVQSKSLRRRPGKSSRSTASARLLEPT